MEKHDNYSDFKPLYGAWTNSSTRIYFNAAYFLQHLLDLDPEMKAEEVQQETRNLMAEAVLNVRHELNHVAQFQANGNKPPGNFKSMVAFEAEAYAGDLTWLGKPQTRDFLVNRVGATKDYVDQMAPGEAQDANDFATWKTLSSADARTTLINHKPEPHLPASLGPNANFPVKKANYVIADLYKTRDPFI